ncbi:MAG TPA: RDD family protein [Candidatus Dormibacteraeota bacterium]|nr:RDD family protein [Candidatus Dormibacteraeota bacterium]
MAPPPTLGGFGYNPEIPYAGFWIRFVAVIVDGVIVFVATIVASIVLAIVIGILARVTGAALDLSPGGPLTWLDYLVSFTISIGYFIYGWGMGSTRGQRFFRLAVVDAESGQPIGFGRAAIRYLGYIVSVLPCYIGLIWAAFDPKKQGWHDKIANTLVIQG